MSDPKTCHHDVVMAGIGMNLRFWVVCRSCNTNVIDEVPRAEKYYVFDSEYGEWVNRPEERQKDITETIP